MDDVLSGPFRLAESTHVIVAAGKKDTFCDKRHLVDIKIVLLTEAKNIKKQQQLQLQ